MKRKPRIVWMVKNRHGFLYKTISQLRGLSIMIAERDRMIEWKLLKKHAGYSVVRVELREVRAAK